MPSSPRVRVVTDSTCALPPAVAAEAGLVVVPLHVVVDGRDGLEGVDVDAAQIASAVRAGARMTTSQPTPAAFAEAYDALGHEGATEIVSVHLSGELSGTVRAAETAASGAATRVHVVDSRTAATGLGLAARQAARLVATGASGAEVAAHARAVAASATVVFLVDSLEHLRRGGRLSRAAAAVGTVLGMRPLLTVRDGGIEVLAKVRTRAAAVDRCAELAVAAAGAARRPIVAVHHLDTPDDAAALAERLAGLSDEPVVVGPVGAVLGAHVGPGLLAVVVVDAAGTAAHGPGDSSA